MPLLDVHSSAKEEERDKGLKQKYKPPPTTNHPGGKAARRLKRKGVGGYLDIAGCAQEISIAGGREGYLKIFLSGLSNVTSFANLFLCKGWKQHVSGQKSCFLPLFQP